MTQPFFTARDTKKPISQAETEILKYWQTADVFQQSIDSRNAKRSFVFFDGPPFATGTPHYGHILAGTIKDVIPRYWTMKGFQVQRKFGWDCHGLPVEYQVEKENKIGGKPGIEAMGVDKFNELCRSIVLRCRDQWEDTVARMGRFVDFKDDYKTMDPEFMESVWWVFKELWDKGLIYEGHKVVAYSPKLGSPLSNFEANLNYQDIDDPAVTIKFKLLEPGLKPRSETKNPGSTYILAWTTTPWTLPSNCALGFGRDHTYALVHHEGDKYWLAEDAVERTFGEAAEVLETKIGKDFVGLKYEPLFDFFANTDEKRFEIIHDDGDYVTTDSGTGIVHMAPFFGAEDDDLCKKFGIIGVNPIGDDGYFTEDTPPLAGKYFRFDPEIDGTKEDNANKWVIATLKETGQLYKLNQIRHSYPHCWRTDCALMYRGITTWFVNVSKIKEAMIAKNKDINWNPHHLRDGRFGKLLEGAPDWAISRNRYWGTPLPIWRCDQTGEIEVMSSREELEAKVGKPVEDLHKHFVDDLTWTNEKTGGTMRRIEEVLDCWFESGSMPYASKHYPFAQQAAKSEVKRAKSKKEKQKIWEFFHKMWLEEFGLDNEKNELSKTSFFDSSKVFYYEEDQMLKGAIEIYWDLKLKHWSIGRVGVITAHRKVGIGKSLIKVAEDSLDGTDQAKITLSGAQKSAGFYEKIGFKQVGEYEQNRNNPDLLCAQFEKPLTPHPSPLTHFQTANFISEGMDQTRGWFYTLHVLGTALWGKNIFKNVICHGIVLAEDGQKMSKSKKNYPDPQLIFDKYGADAMRFYLMKSPVTKGENLRFAEHEVEEVLKNLILPLRNAYQFLSMYANIDGWRPTKFTLIRHGQASHNVHSVYCGEQENCQGLTETGKAQAKDISKKLSNIDHLLSSPMPRAHQTADTINQSLNTSLSLDDRLTEVNFGALEGQPWQPIQDRIENPTTESLADLQTRAADFMVTTAQDHPGAHIGIVSHGGVIRAIQTGHLFGNSAKAEHFDFPVLKTGHSQIVFSLPNTENELDRWIISETQSLIKDYRHAFDQYDLEHACRCLLPFVDKLNNWYLRRNRARFWAPGLNQDKQDGYTTLHYVLLNISKLLAPICPFFAEELYQGLIGETDRSVHLEFIPLPNETLIDTNLQDRTALTRDVVRLAAGIRARQKIKLRQPLNKLQFALSETVDLDLELIKAEANVKTVEILKSIDGVAEQIIKVDARSVGKKYGKKVQAMIQAGKAGKFVMKDSGQVEIEGEILEVGEYELAFLTKGSLQAEATHQVVVLLDTELTPELEQEGLAREIIRAIQELRKASGFEVNDHIHITYETSDDAVLKAFADMIQSETLADSLKAGDADEVIAISGLDLKLNLKKA